MATHTLIERKGAQVGLLTTMGFRDLLAMREGMEEERYNLRMTPVESLVTRHLRLGVPARVRRNGEVAAVALAQEGVDALAVCCLIHIMVRRVAVKTPF